MLFTFIAKAQDFVGKDVNLYLNTTVKPTEASSEGLKQYMYKNFFVQFDEVTKILTEDYIGKKKLPFKPYQIGEYASTSVSEYSKMVGTEYKVVAIYDLTEKYEFNKGRFFVFALTNLTGTIYYKYDSKYEHNLELTVVGGLTYPEGYFCSKIEKEVDKFEDKISFYSPTAGGISLIKSINKGIETYFVEFETNGETANVSKKGLFVLFSDGTKWAKEDADINVKVTDDARYMYSAFVEVKKEDIEIFKTHIITDNRLYIYDRVIKVDDAKQVQEYFKCIEGLK